MPRKPPWLLVLPSESRLAISPKSSPSWTRLRAVSAFFFRSAANVVFEILPVHSLPGNRLFELLHAGQLVFRADGIELLNKFRLDAHAHVLGTLHEKGLVDEIAQRVFLAVFDVYLQLFRRATVLAFGLGFFFGGLARFVVLRAGDDFIVDARNNLLDGFSAIQISRFGSGGFRRLFGFCVGRRHPRLLKSGTRRWFRLRTLRLVLCRERQSGAERRDYSKFSHQFPHL